MSVSLPEGLKSIGYCAFVTCGSLGSIDIPAGVTEIGQYAFGECKSLKSIALPNGLTAISDYTLWNCFGLESVDIPSGITEIGKSAFSGCTSLRSVDLPAGLTTLGKEAFAYCKGLESVDLPDGITALNDYTFQYCYSLRSVALPKGLTSIGMYAFSDCSRLASIDIPGDVSFIDMEAFGECTGLSRVIMRSATPPDSGSPFGEDVTLIVPAEAVEEYEVQDWVRKCAVTYAKAEGDGWVLTAEGDLTVDETYEWKGAAGGECAEAWKDLAADVTSVEIFDGVTNVAPGAFSGFAALESVSLSASVANIGAGAFGGCGGLVSVLSLATAPPSLGEGAFAGEIDDLTVAWASVDAYKASGWGKYFAAVSSDVDGGEGWSLSIDGVLEVGPDYAWASSEYMCEDEWQENLGVIREVIISEGVDSVGSSAFSGCSKIETVSLPSSLTKIGECAFFGCYNISSITCRAATPPDLGEDVFDYWDCGLYVPAEAVETYKKSDWAEFFTDILAIATPPVTAVADVAETDSAVVRVSGGVVTVGGAAARVYSLQGRMMPAGRPIGKGVYIVATPRGAVKVAVR